MTFWPLISCRAFLTSKNGWLQPTDDAGRIAGHYGAGRNVAGDDASCAYYGAFTDGHSGEDGYIAPEPDTVPDGDGQGFLGTLVALLGVEGMDSGEQAAARTDEDVAADGDRGLVENCQVEVDVGAVSD